MRPSRAGAAGELTADQILVPFGFGLLATLSPCALPLYPGFLAYLAAQKIHGPGVRWLGLAVLGGVLTSMLALGAVISLLQIAVGEALVLITPLADLVVIGLGVALFFGANPFARLPTLAFGSSAGSPVPSAYLYGLLYGPIALPCSGPLLIGIFTLSLTVGSLAEKLGFFLLFGLGFGVPLFVIALLAQGRQSALLRLFARHYAVFSRLAGIVLIAAGAWDLSVNMPFVLLYLGL